jgi:hypothetical protein
MIFLAREGLSFATLRRMEQESEDVLDESAGGAGEPERRLAGTRGG